MPAAALGVNALLFTVFALHHSVMARSGAKAWLTRVVPPALERSVYVWIASLIFIATCALWRDIPSCSMTCPGPRRVRAWRCRRWGVWLTLRSAGVIDPLELAGIRQVARPRAPALVQGVRAIPPGAAPDLLRVGADDVRRAADDRHSAQFRRDQHGVPDDRHPFRRTVAHRSVRRRVSGLSAARGGGWCRDLVRGGGIRIRSRHGRIPGVRVRADLRGPVGRSPGQTGRRSTRSGPAAPQPRLDPLSSAFRHSS